MYSELFIILLGIDTGLLLYTLKGQDFQNKLCQENYVIECVKFTQKHTF